MSALERNIYGNIQQVRFDDYLLNVFKTGSKADEIYIELEIIRNAIAIRNGGKWYE